MLIQMKMVMMISVMSLEGLHRHASVREEGGGANKPQGIVTIFCCFCECFNVTNLTTSKEVKVNVTMCAS